MTDPDHPKENSTEFHSINVEPTAQGFVQGTNVNLIKGEFLGLYQTGYYGQLQENILVLTAEEAVLLLERKRIIIYHTAELIEIFTVDKLIEYFSSQIKNGKFWGRYLVYKDLRGRGYVVRPGFGEGIYRRYPRGTKPNTAQSDTFIFPFLGGSFLELHQLDLIVNQAKSNRKMLILGCVDRSGDVTYYRASDFNFPYNHERYEWPDDQKNTIEEQKE
ncbi:MAG: hypothetical protein ACXAC7_00155 [Candidatus Hodarchaeales archaeon]|jgi:tRNA-intron endonuclease